MEICSRWVCNCVAVVHGVDDSASIFSGFGFPVRAEADGVAMNNARSKMDPKRELQSIDIVTPSHSNKTW